MAKENRCPEAMTVFSLRKARGLSQAQLAAALGTDEKSLCRQETNETLSREEMHVLVAPLGFSFTEVELLFAAFQRIFAPPAPVAASPVPLTVEERERIARAAAEGGRSVEAELLAELTLAKQREKAQAAIQEAEELFQLLTPVSPPVRREMVEAFPVFHTWGLAMRFCEASLKAASDKPANALELAALALVAAEKAPAEERWSWRLQGWCWGHLGNARRVATDFDGADEAFTRASQLWEAGEPTESEWLPEWRLLSLKASLRRAQRRLPEALDLLDRAMAGCGGAPAAMARCLLKKEHVFEMMGDIPAALNALTQAEPFVGIAGDAHLYFAFQFKTANNLCHLQRFSEAAELLPEVGELALQQGAEVEGLRVSWLGARVASGLGQTAEAVVRLEQISQRFTDLKLPYEAALSSLELAVLWLEEGRTAGVRELARAMAWIFNAKGIQREALVALKVFREAALREAATVELARRVIAEIETVRRSASPRDGEREAESDS
jgi:tetratricopeptide (TPR) repeat protein/transcriptional regulator with XRE-family HTH domain